MVNLYFKCKKNNTFCTVVDVYSGRTIYTISGGCIEGQNSRRATATVAYKLALNIIYFLNKSYYQVNTLFFKGFGQGRAGIFKAFKDTNLSVIRICQVNNQPFNGCKLKKQRRL